jgi:hypothetical protein
VSIEEHIERLRDCLRQFPELLEKTMLAEANSTTTIIKARIQQEEGIAPASSYSPAYLKKKENRFGSVPFVDLTYDSRMMNNLQIREVERSSDQVLIGVGTDNDADTTKVNANIGRYGEFLQPTGQEESDFLNAVEDSMVQKMADCLL